MKQTFLQVWKDNQLWFEFPSENEDNVRAFLMKENLDRICDIKPKVENIEVLKQAVKQQETIIDLTPKQNLEPKKLGRPKKLI
jgi:hypothetical protein